MRPLLLALAASLLAVTSGPIQAAAPAPPAAADWRPVDADNTLVIDTNQGRIVVELYPQVAPATVARVETLARQHFYDGLGFFRVIDGFMDQTGDPQNNGQGGSSLPSLQAEFAFRHEPGVGVTEIRPIPGGQVGFFGALPVAGQADAMAGLTVDGKVRAFGLFCSGVIGMARAQAEDSANSQFFLMREAQLNLDQKYTAFGRVILGESVVRAIKTGDPVADPQDRMLSVQVLSDMPPASRPDVRVLDTASAYFKAEVARVRVAKDEDFDPCQLEIPAKTS
jgi:peptidylprolyl isomerase